MAHPDDEIGPDINLEADWALLRPQLIKVIRDRGGDLHHQLLRVAEETTFDLTKDVQDRHEGQLVTTELLADLVTTGIRMFLEKWEAALRNRNLAGLIEIVLEGQDLTLREMEEFVRALPVSLLEKISRSVVGTASGTHGLIALEFIRRQANRPYKLGRDVPNGRIWAEFKHPKMGKTVRFYLDEPFEVPETDSSGVNSSSRGA